MQGQPAINESKAAQPSSYKEEDVWGASAIIQGEEEGERDSQIVVLTTTL